ncbi:MAG: type I pullulanase [Phaeodactylibacter sp.]|uniref:type I pullulanase n=1 Tax=Phaeodactylibacter sp. TaxID=1940289 RepID=UPI0032EBE3A9
MLRSFLILTISSMIAASCQSGDYQPPQYDSYDDYPVYAGDDLGLTYTPESTAFRLWSPAAQAVRLHFYSQPLDGEPTRTTEMKPAEQGTWTATFTEDLLGTFYAYQVQVDDAWRQPVPGPYTKAVGTNGMRGQVLDLKATHPEGWENDTRPPFEAITDAVVYELHIRDVSIYPESGITHKGKFLGLAETGTTTPGGITTGLDHMASLGVTHVHLLPAFDFCSLDESKPESERNYNWGYDPQNYNVPEGSYSMDPADGASRIREFKTMVKAMHDKGLRVVLDVVYNHTGFTENSLFNELVPGYYYRHNEDGSFSNASGCGNETASERAMVRKFIVESVKYWAREYHLDGFRFDLMAIHDIETMNAVTEALESIDPSIIVYGEGWTAGDSPLPVSQRALKAKVNQMPDVAAFSDDIRDGLKGSVFEHEEKAFISGKPGREEDVKFGIVASTYHPQVDYKAVAYSDAPWAAHPTQTMTYVSCHDNHTLWDRLAISCPEVSEEERIKMHKLALATVLTSQGASFLHAGTEFLRTKQGVENSYESPDSINQIDWARKGRYQEVVDYVKGLIALRKAHPAFRMQTNAEIKAHLSFLDTGEASNLIAYQIKDNANEDSWTNIIVVLNGNEDYQSVKIPEGAWTIAADGTQVHPEGLGTIEGGVLQIPGRTAMVLYQ